MPSLFEGLPVVGVEAQANGLPCILSSNISKEVILSDNIKMLDLSLGVDSWKDEILNTKLQRNNKSIEQIEEKGYNVVSEVKKLTDLYRNFN